MLKSNKHAWTTLAAAIPLAMSLPLSAAPKPSIMLTYCQKVQNTDLTRSATDFHATFTSKDKGPFNIQGDASLNGTAGQISNNGTDTVTVNWTDLNVRPGDWVSVGSVEYKNRGAITPELKFTYPDPKPTDSLGWMVDETGDVFLTNLSSQPVSFQNLFFQFPSSLTLESTLGLLDMTPSGTPGFLSGGVVPGAVSTDPAELLVGHFDLAEGAFMTAVLQIPDGNSLGTTALGMQVAPEPATIGLVLLTALGLLRPR